MKYKESKIFSKLYATIFQNRSLRRKFFPYDKRYLCLRLINTWPVFKNSISAKSDRHWSLLRFLLSHFWTSFYWAQGTRVCVTFIDLFHIDLRVSTACPMLLWVGITDTELSTHFKNDCILYDIQKGRRKTSFI